MAVVYDIRGKGPGSGMNMSHSHRRNKHRLNPNIQRARALVKGTPKHPNVCTKRIKSERVVRPAAV